MGKENYMIYQKNKIKRMMRDYIGPDLNFIQKTGIFVDFILAVAVYGTHTTDYFQYQFYKKRHVERKTFLVHRPFIRMLKKTNDYSKRRIFDDKALFNAHFDAFLGREWLDLEHASFQEFQSFCLGKTLIFVKSSSGRYGQGITKIELNQGALEDVFESLKGQPNVAEERIVQHESLAVFNPPSVNTLRVVTLVDDNGKTNIMSACIRLGNGDKVADNFHHDGIAALVDIETGIVTTKGVDQHFNHYLVHPLSGIPLVGFQVPYWNEVKMVVINASKVIPSVRYVGWDIAIGEQGDVKIIEGNFAADHDVQQMPDQVGKYPIYKAVLHNF